MAAFEATWPAAEVAVTGAVRSGRGMGAGGRVSSSTVSDGWTEADIAAAEAQHRAWDQPPMFRVQDDQPDIAAALTARGYQTVNPTAILAAPLDRLRDPVDPMAAFTIWPPLAIQRQIWADGNIGPARQAVMDRVTGGKTALLARHRDRAAGAGFVAVHGGVAMIHAVEVVPEQRRQGVGLSLVRKAADWSAAEGAGALALAVSLGNAPAVGLYAALGFAEVGRYAYYTREG